MLFASRQRSEQALTVERNFVAAVLNTISALVLVFDTAGRIVRFNRACEMVSGYSFGDLAGRAFPEELFPPEERETAIRIFEQVRAGNENQSFEINWRSKVRTDAAHCLDRHLADQRAERSELRDHDRRGRDRAAGSGNRSAHQ
jgi:PAS domain S-box-containing protein